MSDQATDRAHQFRDNERLIFGAPDQATKGVPTVAGTQMASTPVSEMGKGMQAVLSPVMQPTSPSIDLTQVDLARSTINDPSQLFQGKIAMPEKGVGDMGYACKSVSNVMGEAASSLFSALTDKSPDKDGMELEAKPTPQFAQQGPKMGMFG